MIYPSLDKPPIVRVTWTDAVFDLDHDKSRYDYDMYTVGFYIEDNATFVCIAQEMTPDGYRAATWIPKVLIHPDSMVELEFGKGL